MPPYYKPSRYLVESISPDGSYVLLFNTRTGALVKIPQSFRNELEYCLSSSGVDEKLQRTRLFRVLVHGGFVVEESIDELEEVRKRYFLRVSKPHLILSVMPTLECNMACPYCFQTRRTGNMNENAAESLVAFIEKRARGTTNISVDWYGGEPLLQADFILRLQQSIRMACERSSKVCAFSMTTNGFLLTPSLCDSLVQGGIRSFQITVDGPKEIHDARRFLVGGGQTFKTIISNIVYAVNNTAVDLRINVDQDNVSYIEPMLENLSATPVKNVRSISFKAVVPTGGFCEGGRTLSMSKFSKISSQLYKAAVRFGFHAYAEPQDVREFCSVDLSEQWIIDPKLNVYKCADSFNIVNDSVGKIMPDGTLELNDTIKVWRSKPIFDDPRCTECVYLPQCMGGCALKKLVHKKDWCPEERFALPSYVQRLFESEMMNSDSYLLLD